MFNQYSPDEGARNNGRDHSQDADDVRDILRRRQRTINPIVCYSLAGGLAAVTLLVWGSVYADARHNPAELLTKAYASFLAFAIVLGLAAAAFVYTCLILRDGRRRSAEEDVIRQFHQQQQIDAIHEAIAVFLREGDRDTHGALSAVQNLIDRSENVTKFPRAHS